MSIKAAYSVVNNNTHLNNTHIILIKVMKSKCSGNLYEDV